LGFVLTLGWVETFVAAYFAKFAGIAKWRQASVVEARAEKQVKTRIGRMIHIPDNATDTSLFCLPVQTNGADGFKVALTSVSEKLNGLDARIVHTQHDEIIVEARDEIADQVQAIVKGAMEEAFKKIIPEVLFVAEIRVAEAWG
jgi:DNA polymerase-1